MRPTTKARILQAATELFSRQGPSGTSVDAIVKRARCNKRMVYHYFGSKEALCREVLMATYEEIARWEKSCITDDSPVSPAALIKNLVCKQIDFLAANPKIVSILMWENLDGGRTVRQLSVGKTKNPLFQTLTRTLSRHGTVRSSKEIKQIFITLTAACFFTFSNRYTLKQIVGFDPAKEPWLSERRRHLIHLFTKGLTLDQTTRRHQTRRKTKPS